MPFIADWINNIVRNSEKVSIEKEQIHKTETLDIIDPDSIEKDLVHRVRPITLVVQGSKEKKDGQGKEKAIFLAYWTKSLEKVAEKETENFDQAVKYFLDFSSRLKEINVKIRNNNLEEAENASKELIKNLKLDSSPIVAAQNNKEDIEQVEKNSLVVSNQNEEEEREILESIEIGDIIRTDSGLKFEFNENYLDSQFHKITDLGFNKNLSSIRPFARYSTYTKPHFGLNNFVVSFHKDAQINDIPLGDIIHIHKDSSDSAWIILEDQDINPDTFSKICRKLTVYPEDLGYSIQSNGNLVKNSKMSMVFFDTPEEAAKWQEMMKKKPEEVPQEIKDALPEIDEMSKAEEALNEKTTDSDLEKEEPKSFDEYEKEKEEAKEKEFTGKHGKMYSGTSIKLSALDVSASTPSQKLRTLKNKLDEAEDPAEIDSLLSAIKKLKDHIKENKEEKEERKKEKETKKDQELQDGADKEDIERDLDVLEASLDISASLDKDEVYIGTDKRYGDYEAWFDFDNGTWRVAWLGTIDGQKNEDLTEDIVKVDEKDLETDLLHGKINPKSSLNKKSTGEMSQIDIEEGGEDYEWAQKIENEVRELATMTDGKVKFIEMKPFDKYQGPYTNVTINGKADQIWDAQTGSEELYIKNMNWIGNLQELADAINGDKEALHRVTHKFEDLQKNSSLDKKEVVTVSFKPTTSRYCVDFSNGDWRTDIEESTLREYLENDNLSEEEIQNVVDKVKEKKEDEETGYKIFELKKKETKDRIKTTSSKVVKDLKKVKKSLLEKGMTKEAEKIDFLLDALYKE